VDADKDGRISYEEFASMTKTGTDRRKASRHYSRGRFNNLSIKLARDGSLQMENNERRYSGLRGKFLPLLRSLNETFYEGPSKVNGHFVP